MMVLMALTTIQDRLRFLLRRTGLTQTALSLKAGQSANYIGRILSSPDRKGISGEAAQGLAFASGFSQSWIATGSGSPDATDVPLEPPPDQTQKPVEGLDEWPSVALAAIDREKGKLDWAVMAVGEELYQLEAPELTVYSVLARAEKIAKATASNPDERERLDAKLRVFLKEHATRRLPTAPAESGRHKKPGGK